MTTAVERSRDVLVRQVLDRNLGSVVEAVNELFGAIESLGTTDLLKAEQKLRVAAHRLCGETLRVVIEHEDIQLRKLLRERCRIHCDPKGHVCLGTLKSKGGKWITVLTLFGEIRVRQWVAECRDCRRLFGAVDELFRLVDGMMPACASLVGLNAVTVPYEQARKLILETSGLEVDDNRIKRVVDELGPRAKTCLEEVPRLRKEGLPPKGSRVYVMMDGGRIRMRDNGGAWREPCTALILWEDRHGHLHKRGISHPTDKQEVLRVVDQWMKRFDPGTDWEVIVIADGADWIWTWAAGYPWAIRILDYYHVKENVWKAAHVLHGEGTPQAQRWVDRVTEKLWSGQPRKMAKILKRMKPREPNAVGKREAIGRLATYIDNHASMIRFKRHRNQERQIGSGAIESMCKQLFSMRMKGPGMFWSEEGAGNLMRLRTLYITEHWDQLWQGNPRLAA